MNKAGISIALLIVAFLLSSVHQEPAMAAQGYSEGLNQARLQAATGDYPAAEQTLRLLTESFPDNPEILAALGRIRLWQQDFAGAVHLFRQSLSVENDPSVLQELVKAEISFLENLLQNGEVQGAHKLFTSLSPSEKTGLSRERPDLPFRIVRNSLKLEGGVFAFSGDRQDERDLAVTLIQRIGTITGVLSGTQVRRFGLTDTQAGLELHSALGTRPARSGYLAATFSPDASFLPRYTVGGEYYQGWRGMEGSLGFSRLSFSDSDVNILIPGVTLYPAETISLNERLYLVLDNGAITALTTLNWKPDYRFSGAYAIGIGSAAERFTSSEDLTRYFTLTNRVTGEYRITPTISFGGELSHEYRRGLYTRTGATLFGRYWW
jgi:YaiO family outer membrane protein